MRYIVLILSISILTLISFAQDYPSANKKAQATVFVDDKNVVSQKKALTIRDQLHLDIPSTIVISPDGKYVAYTIRKPNFSDNKWITQIHLLNVQNKTSLQLTNSTSSCSNPLWSPDGNLLSFTSTRPFYTDEMKEQRDASQLFAIHPDGGEATALTALPNGVDEYTWSPDGSFIAMLTDGDIPESGDTNKSFKTDASSSNDPKAPKELWILRMSDKFAKRIAIVDRGVTSLDVSPDNQTILYQTNYTGEYNDEQKYDIWTISLDGLQTQITKTIGPETKPKFSPDEKSIAFITQTVPDIEFAQTDLCIADANGKNIRNVTKDFDFSVTDFVWEPSGKSILLSVDQKTNSVIYKYDLVKNSITELQPSEGVCSSISGADKSGQICLGYETASTLREIGVIEKGKLNILSHFSDQLKNYSTGNIEVVSYPSTDGKYTIEGLLIKPSGYDASKKYPMVLCVHGGPYGHFKNMLMQGYAIHEFSNNGFVCFMPNVRGSSGYTDEFSQSNRYDLGGGDYQDAMAGVDYLISKEIVDSTRMGVTGGSYGGYLTNWIISQTLRFKAAVSMYGIFSWFTDWSNSFQPSFEQMYFGYNYWDKPLDMNNLYISRAPQTYVKNISTPTLILQGTEDQYTNISNSREMYQALKELGRTAEFVTYKGEGHGLRGKPNNYVDSVERSVKWFKKFLLN